MTVLRLVRDRGGAAAVEMALVVTFVLLPVASGMIGAGQALLTQYRVDRAMHAGMLYAWGLPTATASGIQGAALNGFGGSGATVNASIACYCIAPTATRASGTAVACSGSCTVAAQVVGSWANVQVSAGFSPIFPVPWGGAAWTLSANGTVRIQ